MENPQAEGAKGAEIRGRSEERNGGTMETEDLEEWGVRLREVGNQFGRLISTEKEKKKLTVALSTELESIRGRYERIVDGIRTENIMLRGRLEENRRQLGEAMKMRMTERVKEGKEKRRNEGERENRGKEGEKASAEGGAGRMGKATTYSGAVEGGNKKRGAGGNAREQKREGGGKEKNQPEREEGGSTETRGAGSGGKREDSRGGTSKGTTDTEGRENRENSGGAYVEVVRKARFGGAKPSTVKAWREREPDRRFIVEVGEKERGEVRKELWREIVKRVRAPKFNRMQVLNRGDLEVVPGDKATAEALEMLEREGKLGMKAARKVWPKVVIYDVEREIEGKELARTVREQNEGIGIEEEKEGEVLVPIFRRGPRDTPCTNWVCEVSPEIFGRVTGRKLFIGLRTCRVAVLKLLFFTLMPRISSEHTKGN